MIGQTPFSSKDPEPPHTRSEMHTNGEGGLDDAPAPDKADTRPADESDIGGEGVNSSARGAETAGMNPAYEQFQREYVERYARYEQPQPRRRRMPKFAYMAAVFVIGAVVGVGSAWWLNPHAQTDKADIVPGITGGKPSQSVLAATAQPSDPSQDSGVRGISRSELPYDGVPPGDTEAAPEVPSATQRKTPMPATGSSGPSVEDGDMQAATVQSKRQRRQDAKPEPAMSPSARQTPMFAEVPGPTRMAEERSSPLAGADSKALAPVPKRQLDTTTTKDLEIDRIRRQAEEELKKKTEAKRRLAEARERKEAPAQRASSQASASGNILKARSTQAMLARCEQASNFFLREQCKWKLCNGMWGKNGCPSYNRPASNNAY